MEAIQQALQVYFKEWKTWCAVAYQYSFADLKPMHVGWKVRDEATLGHMVSELLSVTEQGHIGTVDNRKIVLLALEQPVEDVPVLQLMQLRPASTDPVGLDHVAFYCKDIAALEAALQDSPYKWEYQSNPGHQWISLWFGDKEREVKFFDHTSLDIGAHELETTSTAIKSR